MRGHLSRLVLAALLGASAILAACQASTHSPTLPLVTNQARDAQPNLRLKTAHSVVCVHPSTAPQKVTMPPAAGVSGTMSFTAFAAAASGCDYVEISTGNDAKSPDANGSAKPLLTISVGEGFDGHPLFDNSMIVTGMQLMVSPDLHFPDGTYYATITTTRGDRSTLYGRIVFTAKDGVLKIPAIELPNGKSFPLILTAKTSSIITLYPRGVEPPPPTPSPSPSTSPTPSGSPTPIPTPLPTSKPCKGCHGLPPPAYGDEIGISSYDEPSPPCTGSSGAPCTGSSPIEQQTIGGSIEVPGGMFGTITYGTKIGYMALLSVTNNCPKDWLVDAGLSGDGIIVIPESHPFNQPCEITWSTIPARGGNGYTETLYLQGVD